MNLRHTKNGAIFGDHPVDYQWNEKSTKRLLLGLYLLDAEFAGNSSPLKVSCIGRRPWVTIHVHTIVTTVKAMWLHRLKEMITESSY